MYTTIPNFLPFVGSSYGTNNMFGRRIMVMGESHYGTQPSPDFTNEVMALYLNKDVEREPWMNTFVKFERSLVNKETTPNDSVEIWNSLLFYNYVQVLMEGSRVTPLFQEFKDSEAAFYSVLDEHKPEILIVWGKRLWNHLPHDRWEDGEEVTIGDNSIDNGVYSTLDGARVRTFCVYHPSASYSWDFWHQVISHFIEEEDRSTFAINQMGFLNFRRFVEFPTLELGGVNLIVGPNNAGKSSFDKATILYLDFIQKWITDGNITLNFSSDLCSQIGINSFEEALSYGADERCLTFRMTIGRYTYETVFKPLDSNSQTSESNHDFVIPHYGYTTGVSAENIKVIDNSDNEAQYVFNYGFQSEYGSSTTVEADAVLPLFTPSDEAVRDLQQFLYSPMCTLETELKEAVNAHLDAIFSCISSEHYSKDLLEHFETVTSYIGEEIPKDKLRLFTALQNVISQLSEDKEEISIRLILPRNTSIQTFLNLLGKINVVQEHFSKSSDDDAKLRHIDYVGIIDLIPRRTFSINDTDSLAKSIIWYCQRIQWRDKDLYSLEESARSEDRVSQFILQWMEKFEIGKNLIFKKLENEAFAPYVTDNENRIVPLASLGLGSIHIMALVLRIAQYVIRRGSLDKELLIVEEPEINLHPNRQSLLADLFLDIYQKFGVQLIVETHSEYLVRKTQAIVSFLNVDEFDVHPFVIYYFPGDNQPYRVRYTVSGRFTRSFGKGFYDESSRSTYYVLKKENK